MKKAEVKYMMKFDKETHKALKMQALIEETTVKDIINKLVKAYLKKKGGK